MKSCDSCTLKIHIKVNCLLPTRVSVFDVLFIAIWLKLFKNRLNTIIKYGIFENALSAKLGT